MDKQYEGIGEIHKIFSKPLMNDLDVSNLHYGRVEAETTNLANVIDVNIKFWKEIEICKGKNPPIVLMSMLHAEGLAPEPEFASKDMLCYQSDFSYLESNCMNNEIGVIQVQKFENLDDIWEDKENLKVKDEKILGELRVDYSAKNEGERIGEIKWNLSIQLDGNFCDVLDRCYEEVMSRINNYKANVETDQEYLNKPTNI